MIEFEGLIEFNKKYFKVFDALTCYGYATNCA